jgi:hypothetical protein
MEALSSSGDSDILLTGGGDDTDGRSIKGLGEGVRLGFRNADFSGVLTGRGLSTGRGVGVLTDVTVVSQGLEFPFCRAGGVGLVTGFSRPRGGKAFGLVGLDGEVFGEVESMGGGWVLACSASASCFNTWLTDGGALMDSSLLFGFIEILASRLTLTASSTMLIRFVWG